MSKDKLINFEDSIEELEHIVKKLEDGNLSLDDSLKEFQKGVEAYRQCNEILNNVEGQVKLIIEEQLGTIDIIDFDDID